MFVLSFKYSQSKQYPKALEIADQLGGKMLNGIMEITFHEHELLYTYERILPLMQIISKWRGVSGNHNGRSVDPYRFVFNIWRNVVECAEKRNSTWNERHCWNNNDQEGWGCKLLNPFSRHLYGNGKYKRSNRFWYNFGEFESNNVWRVNKKLIHEALLLQAQELNITICPFFSKSKLSYIVENLPDKITIDNIKYRKIFDEFGKPINIRHIPPEHVVPDMKNILSQVPFYCKN